MITRIGICAARRAWWTICLWLVIVAATAPLALALPRHLEAGGFTNPRGDAVRAQHIAEQAFKQAPNTLLLVLSGDRPVDDRVGTALSVAAHLPHVQSVQDFHQHAQWLSADHRTTFLEVGFDADDTTVQNLVPVAEHRLGAALRDQPVHFEVTGAPALDYALSVDSQKDVERAELLALPVLFAVLLLVFRSVMAMFVPLLMAGPAIVVSNGIGFLATKATELTILYGNAVSMIGLAVAIDYSLFIIKRFREELDAGVSVTEANLRAMRTAGHSVLFSGLAVVVALSALLIPRITVFTTVGLGGIVVTVIALAMSMTLLPAMLQLLGKRIDLGRLPGRRRDAPETGSAPTGRYRRPAAVAAVTLASFLALAVPAFGLRLQVPVASASILPTDASARRGIDRIEKNVGVNDLFPVQVVLTAPTGEQTHLISAATTVTHLASADPAVARTTSISTLGESAEMLRSTLLGHSTRPSPQANAALSQLWNRQSGTAITQVLITPRQGPDSVSAHNLVRRLRQEIPGTVGGGVSVLVGGATAAGVDFDQQVTSSLPVVIGFISAVTFVLLAIAFRSVLLPLMALVFNSLVTGAALGIVTLVLQNGIKQEINSVTPILLLAVMFGLSMDYMVIMISRMKEYFRSGRSHHEAVVLGLGRTAGMVNGAALIMIAVFASFGTAQISVVQQLGIGLAIAVALDSVVIRRVLMPNAILLTGSRIWGPAPNPADGEPALAGVGGE